jgi:hypothetical protein
MAAKAQPEAAELPIGPIRPADVDPAAMGEFIRLYGEGDISGAYAALQPSPPEVAKGLPAKEAVIEAEKKAKNELARMEHIRDMRLERLRIQGKKDVAEISKAGLLERTKMTNELRRVLAEAGPDDVARASFYVMYVLEEMRAQGGDAKDTAEAVMQDIAPDIAKLMETTTRQLGRGGFKDYLRRKVEGKGGEWVEPTEGQLEELWETYGEEYEALR